MVVHDTYSVQSLAEWICDLTASALNVGGHGNKYLTSIRLLFRGEFTAGIFTYTGHDSISKFLLCPSTSVLDSETN